MATIDESTYEPLRELLSKIRSLKCDNKTTPNNKDDVKFQIELKHAVEPLLTKIDELLCCANEEHESYIKLLVIKSSVLYEQAKILIAVNEEHAAKDLLFIAMDNIKDKTAHPLVVFLYFRLVNHYSYLLSKHGELDLARQLLESTELLYNDLQSKSQIMIYNTEELLKEELPHTAATRQYLLKFEKLVTHNLQMLGWIYNRQNQHDSFAIYHHAVLRRQLEMRDGNPLTWSVKCARLASYFMSKQKFRESRHHLAASCAVLEEYERDLKKFKADPNFIMEWDELQRYYADISRYWVRYGLYLFNVSKSKIVTTTYGDSVQVLENILAVPFSMFNENSKGDGRNPVDNENHLEGAQSPMVSDKQEQGSKVDDEKCSMSKSNDDLLRFPSLRLDSTETQVTCDLIETTEQARALFLYTHAWLKRSKMFYTLRDYPIEYVNAILDLSELYRFLAFYERDTDSQYNVHKRRMEALETLSAILREVRPQCYVAVSIELLRELSEVQLELMCLNLKRLYATQDFLGENPTTEYIHKMEAVSHIHNRLEHFNDVMSQTEIGGVSSTQLNDIISRDMTTDVSQSA